MTDQMELIKVFFDSDGSGRGKLTNFFFLMFLSAFKALWLSIY